MISEESPTILTIDNLLSEDDIKTAMKCIEMECVSTATTSDYQEDIFRDGAEEEEDNHFSDAVERALSNSIGTQQNIPVEHVNSPLEQFLWVVTNHPNAMDQEDIVTGANFIQRRQARQKWESEGGRQLLELSMDEKPFAKAGKRYEMPNEVKDMLLEKILRRIMRNPQNWSVHDATIVKYDEGESQVPHVDPCDCTILVYFDDGATCTNLKEECSSAGLNGGDTCFPVIGCTVPVEVGRVLLFFSSTPPPSGERDVTSIHHGGLVQSGRKVVAQVMLSFGGENSSISSWLEILTVQLIVKMVQSNTIVIEWYAWNKHEDSPPLRLSFLLKRSRGGGTGSSLYHFDQAGRMRVEADQNTLPVDCHLHFLALRPSTRNDNNDESEQRKYEVDVQRIIANVLHWKNNSPH